MFESIRKHSKIAMFLMFLLIIPSFILVGVERYMQSSGKETVVARVDGKDITQGEWDAAHARQVENIRAQMPTVDSKLLESPQARYATLEQLVRTRVMAAALEKSHVRASDSKVAQALRESPELAAALNADGSLDMDKFRAMVPPGVTPQMLRENIRGDLSMRMFSQSVTATSFAPAGQADVAMNALLEQRDIQVALFKSADFASKVVPTDVDVEAYYKQHIAEFQNPEQAKIEYVVLSLDAVAKTIVPTEQELKAAYEAYTGTIASGEERRASHILIAAGKDMPAPDREKARARAQALVDALRKNPAGFAEAAKKNSADSGSAAHGGDLDFFKRGAMVPPFEKAVFAMKKGDISDVVETDFGFHIIQLTDIRTPKQRTFEEMRSELEASVRKQRAPAQFAEVAEGFSNDVYEQPDSLKPVADRLKLPVQVATVTRPPTPGVSGVLANDKFLEAVFSADATQQKRNTRAIEVGPSQFASAHVIEYSPARASSIEEVRQKVRERIVQERSVELARKEAADRKAEWSADPSKAKLAASVVVSRREPKDQPSQVIDAALRAKPADKPLFVEAQLPGQGFAVIKVNKALAPDAVPDALQRQQRNQYQQLWSSAEDDAYAHMLQERFKGLIKVPKP
jgi:peptidyl-prolyl cis-trans isomerase D